MNSLNKLPWKPGHQPLMLAPMQGLTNQALRDLFISLYKPDVVFTEYIRVISGRKKNIAENDRQEILNSNTKIPTVVQLIGGKTCALTAAADTVQELGAKHINLNLGCPFGRMNNNTAGGNLLHNPSVLTGILSSLRSHIDGSFSVKIRSGFDNSRQIFELISLFESCQIDFIILHPRTVIQRYTGHADHQITTELVEKTSLPVIANGDVITTQDGHRTLEQTKAQGLMIGRGAISDPWIFERLRGNIPAISSKEQRKQELSEYLQLLLSRYQTLFCGETQVLHKMRETINQIHDPDLQKIFKNLRKSKNLNAFTKILATNFPATI